jgi:signal transduction histidine kinase
MVEISVTDTGVGIPGNTMAKLFKLGEKVGRKGTANELSTGLGLVICKEFVEKNGGKIWVESKESIGSTFYFTLHNYAYNLNQEKNGLFE